MASTNSISIPSLQINEISSSPPDSKTQLKFPNLHLNTPSNHSKLNVLKSPSRSLSPSRLSTSSKASTSSRPPSPTNPNIPMIYSRSSSPSREHLKDATMKYVDDLLFVFYDALDNYPINQI